MITHLVKKATRGNGHHATRYSLDQLKTMLYDGALMARDKTTNMLKGSLRKMKRRSARVEGSINAYIAKKPYTAMAIAAFSGMLWGLKMRGKQRNKHHSRH